MSKDIDAESPIIIFGQSVVHALANFPSFVFTFVSTFLGSSLVRLVPPGIRCVSLSDTFYSIIINRSNTNNSGLQSIAFV